MRIDELATVVSPTNVLTQEEMVALFTAAADKASRTCSFLLVAWFAAWWSVLTLAVHVVVYVSLEGDRAAAVGAGQSQAAFASEPCTQSVKNRRLCIVLTVVVCC
jgi:hypothetical protein